MDEVDYIVATLGAIAFILLIAIELMLRHG